jgi:putative Holliday junction resolvase
VADPLRLVPQPLDVYSGEEAGLLEHIAHLLEEREVDTLLVGDPLQSDGSAGGRSEEVGAFVERLRTRFPELSVVRHDEHLTTKEAEALLAEAGFHGAERKARKDSWSALVLLRDWISCGEPR